MQSFPVMQYETKYGVDFRVGATEPNIRSGSKLIGYMRAPSKLDAIETLKAVLLDAVEKQIWLFKETFDG